MISIKKQGEKYEAVDENGKVLFDFPQNRYQELVQAFSMENLKAYIQESISDLHTSGVIPQHIPDDKLTEQTLEACKKYGDAIDFFVLEHSMMS